MKKLYLLKDLDDNNDQIMLASYNKNELLQKLGQDFLDGRCIDSYRLFEANTSDIKFENKNARK